MDDNGTEFQPKSLNVRMEANHMRTLAEVDAVWELKGNTSEAVRKCVEQTGYQLSNPGRSIQIEVLVEFMIRVAVATGAEVSDLIPKLMERKRSA